MRLRMLLATMLLGAGVAQAQVVSPLGGSTAIRRALRPRPGRRRPARPQPRQRPPRPPPATADAPAAAATPRHRRTLDERFAAANTTHDGKLTLEQARAGRLRAVARDFAQIDTGKRGYVTIEEIKAHQSAQRAAHRAARAAQKPATAAPASH